MAMIAIMSLSQEEAFTNLKHYQEIEGFTRPLTESFCLIVEQPQNVVVISSICPIWLEIYHQTILF